MSFPFLKDFLYFLFGVEVPLTQHVPHVWFIGGHNPLLWEYGLERREFKRLQAEGMAQFPYNPSEFCPKCRYVQCPCWYVGG